MATPSAPTRPGRPERPDVPAPAARAAATTFGLLSRLRGARVFHPQGLGYAATLRIGGPVPEHPDVPLLARPGEHRALVRFSRGAGLPEPLPDVLGLSVRLPDVHGPGRHQDFLLVSSIDAPLLHHLLVPALRGFGGASFSSLLLYRVGEAVRLVGALPRRAVPAGRLGALPGLARAADAGELRFALALAPLTGRWHAVGDLAIGERLPAEETERLAFTPWNTGGGIRPVGPLMGLRRAAYRGSQAGRGLTEAEIP